MYVCMYVRAWAACVLVVDSSRHHTRNKFGIASHHVALHCDANREIKLDVTPRGEGEGGTGNSRKFWIGVCREGS